MSPDNTGPAPQAPTELELAVARQRGSRTRVLAAAVAIGVAVVTAACTQANAATPDRSNAASTAATSGHAGHHVSAAADPSAAPAADEGDAQDPAGAADTQGAAGKGKGNGAQNGNGGKNGQGNGKKDDNTNGLDVLGRDCSKSKLPEHTGFQVSPACVDTAFGEVAAVDKSPSLLITKSPQEVKVGEKFTLTVSTRNLVRDRFLGAAAGGYYLESSFLNADGIQRGHFHTACRMLPDTAEAPDSSGNPEFFLATQDNKGGAGTSDVDIEVTGMPRAGIAQCTSWAGDGSHRIPMMTRANQTPAVDSVRVVVKGS